MAFPLRTRKQTRTPSGFPDGIIHADGNLWPPRKISPRARCCTQPISPSAQARPYWRESPCTENNAHARIGDQDYMLSPDGLLMSAKKDQAPPDLRYFKGARK
jgi:hypothetical protein